MPEDVAVNVRNRAHTITAFVDIPDGLAVEGVLLAIGSVLGGFSFYVLDGCLHYVHNLAGIEQHRDHVDARASLPDRTSSTFECASTGDYTGTGRLLVDGELVGEGALEHLTPARFSITGGGLTCGYELGPAVSSDYEAPFRFNATLHRVVVDVSGARRRSTPKPSSTPSCPSSKGQSGGCSSVEEAGEGGVGAGLGSDRPPSTTSV